MSIALYLLSIFCGACALGFAWVALCCFRFAIDGYSDELEDWVSFHVSVVGACFAAIVAGVFTFTAVEVWHMADTKVRTSTRLWSQEVAAARAKDELDYIGPGAEGINRLLDDRIPAYEFSGGRKFTRKASDPYA